ncbi:MAG TPA: radical SAM protein [Geobacterales bacterium]|nr:radical SAM protein [Geobacterales bacterium]
MVRVVLTCDRTLAGEFHHIPLLDFFSCAPVERTPKFLYDFLTGQVPTYDGIMVRAPYPLRKIEAGLLRGYKPNEVVVVHPDHVHKYIDEDTRIVGINSMDPLGLGPVTMMFTYGGVYTAYTKYYFIKAVNAINEIRRKRNLKFKLVMGGSGAWQLDVKRNYVDKLGIDHVIMGEVDHLLPDLFYDIENDGLDRFIKIRGHPNIEDIPIITRPAMHGFVETMRGCGRNCHFCEPNLRVGRYMPIERIRKEILTNLSGGISNVWLHSEDIFLYKVEDKSYFYPNRDALIELFSNVMSIKGVTHANPTHGTVAPAAADPGLIKDLSKILRAGPRNWIGIQPGLESGSGRILTSYMPLKAKPFDAEDWSDVIFEGNVVLNENYWFPAYTIIIGLPGEKQDDLWETARLIDRLERELPKKVGEKAHFTVTPLSFVPIGLLRDKDFYSIDEQMSEAAFAVIYRAWRHTIMEISRAARDVFKTNPLFKAFMFGLCMFGANIILRSIEKWGEKQGFDPEKAKRLRWDS